jgi:Ca2+/Na+ antiporter
LNKNQKYFSNKAIKIDIVLVIITIIIPIIIMQFNIPLNLEMVGIFLLFLAMFYYINHNVHKLYLEKEDKLIEEENIKQSVNHKKTIIYFIFLILIAVALYVIGELLSHSLTNLSNIFGFPDLVLGILLGVITSIPELVTFIESQRKEKAKNSELANKLGVVEATNNLLTSNVLNLFFIQSVGIIIYTFLA